MKEEKQPILDEIYLLRQSMVNDCVHPFEQLVFSEEMIHCKFCDRKFTTRNERNK